MNTLLKNTEVYFVDTEENANALIKEAQVAEDYELGKYSSTYKEKKQKGVVIASYYEVSLTKIFSKVEDLLDI